MQRNQWPLRYKASEVKAACERKEMDLRAEALDLRHQAATAVKDPSEYCQSCGQPKEQPRLLNGTRFRSSSNPLRDAEAADKRADEYGRWAKALTTRGEDTLALHFDDAEYFGLLVDDAELLKSAPKQPDDLRRTRPSSFAAVS